MIVIIDYGTSNLGSICNMLKKVGARAVISSKADDIQKGDKLILPGVGAFDNAMKNLIELGLISLLNEKVLSEKTPILGICMGMQLFTQKSEEGILPGLGWIEAETIKFRFNDPQKKLKIPHMGWNTVEPVQESALFDNMYEEPRFYFLHSYYVVSHCQNDILTRTTYGHDFVSSVIRDNIAGVQFHPEKSHKFGMKILENFAREC